MDMTDHHPFSRATKRTIKKNCPKLLEKIDFDFKIKVPARLHFNYNYVFAGDFLHTEVLGKLDKLFSGQYYVYNDKINQVAEFLFYVHVNKNKGIALAEERIEEIDNALEGLWRTRPLEIAQMLDVNVEDVIAYLERFFFHPRYKRYSLKTMSDLSLYGHSPERHEKTNGNGFHNHYLGLLA